MLRHGLFVVNHQYVAFTVIDNEFIGFRAVGWIETNSLIKEEKRVKLSPQFQDLSITLAPAKMAPMSAKNHSGELNP